MSKWTLPKSLQAIVLMFGGITLQVYSSQVLAGTCGFVYCYDQQTGECRDDGGNVGFNTIDAIELKTTRMGQCGNFQGAIFPYALDENENPTGPYENVDLRGADLKGSRIEQLYKKLTGRFEGADLSTFHFGYTVVTGEVDSHTKLPAYCVPQQKVGLPAGIMWIDCTH